MNSGTLLFSALSCLILPGYASKGVAQLIRNNGRYSLVANDTIR